MKILISWIAQMHDFTQDGKVNFDGPTMSFHENFFSHEKHIILSSAKEDDTRANLLENALAHKYPDRKERIELHYMNIANVIDIQEIKSKVEQLLITIKEDEIDIFFSPGTSAMQIVWYICHTTLKLNTRLFQTQPGKFNRDKKPKLLEVTTEFSTAPVSAIIRETAISGAKSKTDYLITGSIKDAYRKAELISNTDNVTTLITGASGTGKEHLASYIHQSSARKDKPFITVNCAAFNDQLLEARLFGHTKGAFTGADKEQKGIFEEASGGTIFLDEIGDISTYMQQSLLRVLQEKEVLPLGSNKAIKVNVRVIAATNKNLPELCEYEKYRWDLYYRLTVTELVLPALRDRTISEKEKLIKHFLKTKKFYFNRSKELNLSKEAINEILNYSFPGNIRELENMIEQLYVFCTEKVEVADLPSRLKLNNNSSLAWKDVEKAHINKVLITTRGNQRKAWKILQYGSLNTLVKKIKEYDIDVPKSQLN